ncbi:MAG: hypothetical protein F6K23_19835 [Okeania sp. SIO2C9]|uniref:hypothetical protein n=1 Tax=Okeania sp. SIO2C9 TaxID=2607791 RepID=UPI0013C140D9|nr:hypothetical protein [Okeania sp. SIO2C9]NEQ75095.1 hypothetical protein [Okeania sp. SIO2C9]
MTVNITGSKAKIGISIDKQLEVSSIKQRENYSQLNDLDKLYLYLECQQKQFFGDKKDE